MTQRVNKTDWFFLVGSLSRDANTRRHLKWEFKKKLNARLAIRQRFDLFEANISANKISRPQARARTRLKENTVTASKI